MMAIVIGFLTGFVMAMPPGPVAVTAMRVSLDKGSKQGILLSMGNGVMDFLYCTISIFAASAAINTLNEFSAAHPFILLLIQLTIVAGLLIFGIYQLRSKKNNPDELQKPRSRTGKFFDNLAHKGPFLLGIAIATANLPNPTFLPGLVGVTGTILKLDLFEPVAANNFFFAVGFGFGNFVWLYVLVRTLVHFKKRFSEITLKKIHKFAGITLIGVGTVLGYRILTITHWGEVFRFLFAF